MEKKIMFLISNIVGMTLFTQAARLEQTVQLLRAVCCDDCLAGQHRAAGRSRCGSDANQGCNQEADVRPPLTVTPSSVMSS